MAKDTLEKDTATKGPQRRANEATGERLRVVAALAVRFHMLPFMKRKRRVEGPTPHV